MFFSQGNGLENFSEYAEIMTIISYECFVLQITHRTRVTRFKPFVMFLIFNLIFHFVASFSLSICTLIMFVLWWRYSSALCSFITSFAAQWIVGEVMDRLMTQTMRAAFWKNCSWIKINTVAYEGRVNYTAMQWNLGDCNSLQSRALHKNCIT